jgi:peptidoglycan/xylan/chitin deacetylase (PgdA/CDA1 family)
MIPHRTPFLFPLLYPSLTWRIPTHNKEIYLTFDDGPVHGPTDFVLAELERRAVKATFFCIGDNIVKHQALFTRVVAAGHAIGNHTFNHLNGWKTRTAAYVENAMKFDASLRQVHQAPSAVFRPPYGRIRRAQIHALQPHYRIIMWDVLSRDYDKHLKPERCLRNTIAVTRPGSVVVFHDSYKAEKNLVYALPRFIDHFCDKGFTFKVLVP